MQHLSVIFLHLTICRGGFLMSDVLGESIQVSRSYIAVKNGNLSPGRKGYLRY